MGWESRRRKSEEYLFASLVGRQVASTEQKYDEAVGKAVARCALGPVDEAERRLELKCIPCMGIDIDPTGYECPSS